MLNPSALHQPLDETDVLRHQLLHVELLRVGQFVEPSLVPQRGHSRWPLL